MMRCLCVACRSVSRPPEWSGSASLHLPTIPLRGGDFTLLVREVPHCKAGTVRPLVETEAPSLDAYVEMGEREEDMEAFRQIMED